MAKLGQVHGPCCWRLEQQRAGGSEGQLPALHTCLPCISCLPCLRCQPLPGVLLLEHLSLLHECCLSAQVWQMASNVYEVDNNDA